MNTFTVTTECGAQTEFESRRDAEEGIEVHRALCETCDDGDIRLTETPDRSGDSGVPQQEDGTQPVEPSPAEAGDPQLSVLPDSIRRDPLDVIPDYMIDIVEGQPAINKRGYAVIANHFDIVVQAEAITTAGETDHEYAEFKARAWRRGDGPENGYTGHAAARASEDRRGIEDNLNEMAETRAMKRAVAWASGVGILAWEELAGYLDDERPGEPSRPAKVGRN